MYFKARDETYKKQMREDDNLISFCSNFNTQLIY
jgi:hypothetical protein